MKSSRALLILFAAIAAAVVVIYVSADKHPRVSEKLSVSEGEVRSHRIFPGKLNIVATTTLLQSLAQEIGGKHVKVSVLIAPGSCPGHYDICPQDIQKLSSSNLVLTHGFEGFVDDLLKSMGKDKPEQVKIKVPGCWMIPDVYLNAAEKVTEVFCKVDPKHSTAYHKSLSSIRTRVKKLAEELLSGAKLNGATGVAVLCSDQQEPFIRWMGFKIAGTYSRVEEFTPTELHSLTALGREHKVRVVVDNLQSGPTAGKELARDINARHVILSSFPGGFEATDTWAECVNDNFNRIFGVIK